MTMGLANQWLDHYSSQWHMRPHPRGTFYCDVTESQGGDMAFQWWRLMPGTLWGEHCCNIGVRVWAVCWLRMAYRAGFHIILENGDEYTLVPARGAEPQLGHEEVVDRR